MTEEWSLIYQGFDPDNEDLREALCTLGNGYFATRGAGEESSADGVHYPGTYLAGGYNRLKTKIAGRVIENEDLVNLPNWLSITFRTRDTDWFNVQKFELLEYRQELDLKNGLLMRTIRFQDEKGHRSQLITTRLADIHMAAIEWRFRPENWSGEIQIRSALDARVVNDGVKRYRGLNNKHLEYLAAEWPDIDSFLIKVQTNQSEIRVAQVARTEVFTNNRPVKVERVPIQAIGFVGQEFTLEANQGETISVEKAVAFYTSRDYGISECGLDACNAVRDAGRFSKLRTDHELSWLHLWRQFEMDIVPSDHKDLNRIKMIMRLSIFHLLQSVSPNTMDLDVGVPPRGWHGEAYRGHIFWDELFIFPFLNLRMPEITRSLLMYRYRRLDKARMNAAQAGYEGAMYPWQSGSNGKEESQTLHLNPKSGRWIPDNSSRQRHVNSAIAYNIIQYYQATADTEFLFSYGAEMLLEIARFWSSIAEYNEELDRYEIKCIMGPDEYHDQYPNSNSMGLNNNAYTNVMAAWVFAEALNLLELLPDDRCTELREMMDLRDEELQRWSHISRKLRVVFHDDGIISQFEGYDQLEEFDWDDYTKKYGDIQRLDRILEAENDTPNHYKVSKQADVLMLFYLFSDDEINRLFEQLGYKLDHNTIPKNIEYYLNRTSHGSTLSQVVHSRVLMRSDRPRSWKLFKEALESDVADIQGGTTPEGIHLGVMAGTVDLLQRGYPEVELRGDMLRFNPCLPHELEKINMEIRYRGHSLKIELCTDRLKVTAQETYARPIHIAFKDTIFQVGPGETKEVFTNSKEIPS